MTPWFRHTQPGSRPWWMHRRRRPTFVSWIVGGRVGHYGFYEALDFTPDRLAEGERVAVVRAYMAHHQGMTIVGIANALRSGVMQGFFHAEAAARATELLLQEKPPRSVESPQEGSEAEAREATAAGAGGSSSAAHVAAAHATYPAAEQRSLRGNDERRRGRL